MTARPGRGFLRVFLARQSRDEAPRRSTDAIRHFCEWHIRVTLEPSRRPRGSLVLRDSSAARILQCPARAARWKSEITNRRDIAELLLSNF